MNQYTEKRSREELKKAILSLCSVMSVSGYETRSADRIREVLAPHFDECHTDAVGNHLFVRRSGRKDAPKILVDAHYDEIGMMVSEICEGGFLRMVSVGGISPTILQGADVLIYGKKTLRGVITSTPPHLRSGGGEKETLPPCEELLVDTGYSKESLETLVSVGTPVGFAPVYGELRGEQLMGKSFDDKACAAAAVHALAGMDRADQAGDVYLLLASQEEVGLRGGETGAVGIDPDYALVIDVTHGSAPDTGKDEAFPLGEGITISLSAATDLRLTRRTVELAREAGIKFTRVVEAANTGTDANVTQLVRCGIPTVLASLPLRSMHTYNEVLSVSDAEELVKLVSAFVGDARIAEDFAR